MWGNDAPPMRFEETLQHYGQQSGVPPARRIGISVHTPHGASLRAGLIRLRAFSTFIGHKTDERLGHTDRGTSHEHSKAID